MGAPAAWGDKLAKQCVGGRACCMRGYYKLGPRGAVHLVITAALLFLLYQRKKKEGEVRITTTTHYEDLPTWVVDPASKRAEWINKLIRHLWPRLSEAVDKKLRAAEEDQDLLRSIKLNKLSFRGTHLGSSPPKVTGIKVHSWPGSREVVADVGIRYDGGSAVVARAEAFKFTPAVSVTLDNLSFSGTLRLHLRPLLPRVPFFGGVSVGFVSSPSVDFDLGGAPGAALELLPGLHLLVLRFVKEQINSKLVLPNKMDFNLVSNEAMQSASSPLTERRQYRVLAAAAPGDSPTSAYIPDLPAGVLSVHLVEAKSLVNKDSALLAQGKSDPYVKLTIVADGASHTFR